MRGVSLNEEAEVRLAQSEKRRFNKLVSVFGFVPMKTPRESQEAD